MRCGASGSLMSPIASCSVCGGSGRLVQDVAGLVVAELVVVQGVALAVLQLVWFSLGWEVLCLVHTFWTVRARYARRFWAGVSPAGVIGEFLYSWGVRFNFVY